MIWTALLSAAAAVAQAPAATPGPAPSAPAPALTADEQRQADWILARGRLLYAIDRAAWVATDDLRSRVPDLAGAGIAGYVVDRDPQGLVAIFYAREGERLVTAYRARIGPAGVVNPEVFARGSRPELTPVQARMARVVGLLQETASSVPGCGRFNTAVVPPDRSDGPIDGYLLTAQMQGNSWPFGGHYRITVSDGDRVSGLRSFTRSCLFMPAPPPQLRHQGAAMAVTHLLDPTPTEIHVFTALASQQPIIVMVDQPPRAWEVTGERVRILQNGPVRPR